MPRLFRYVAGWLVFLASVTLPGIGAPKPNPMIGRKEAAKLVFEALRRQHLPSHLVASHIDDAYDSEFIYFYVYGPNQNASPHLGNFAVNPWTGDVYNSDSCALLTSPSLKKHQDKIPRRLRLTPERYELLHAKRPICGAD